MWSANLLTIKDPALRAYGRVGVSDHTLGLAVPVAAAALGATMLEKHLTLSRADGGPDAGFSTEPHEFKVMVDACREAEAALGTVQYGPTEAERASLQFRRSLWVREPIPKGTVLRTHHFEGDKAKVVSARPSGGAHPTLWPHFTGLTTTVDLNPGDPFTQDAVT